MEFELLRTGADYIIPRILGAAATGFNCCKQLSIVNG